MAEVRKTEVSVEVVVTDDSHDVSRTVHVIEPLYKGVRHVVGPRRGLPANRNNGVRNATGDYFIFIDDDCIPAPGWLPGHIKALGEHGDAIIGGPIVQNEPRCSISQEAPSMQSGLNFFGCNFSIGRNALDRIGGFNENYFFFLEDIELAVRARRHGVPTEFSATAVVEHPWRDIPSIKRKFIEVTQYGRLLRDYPEQWDSYRPLIAWKICMGRLFSLAKRFFQPLSGKKYLFPLAVVTVFRASYLTYARVRYYLK